MTKVQRVRNVLFGLIMILAGALFLINPTESYPVITFVLSIGMTLRGIRLLVSYFSMARYMVDGRFMLYQAVIMIDMGLFTCSLTQVPLVYVMLYLIGLHLFAGTIDIMRALGARRFGSPWKVNLTHGIINVLMAITCLIFIKTTWLAVMIYAAGVIYSGIMRIITAFRRTAMVYIQ